MKRLHHFVTSTAADWNVSPRAALTIFWTPIIGSVVVAASRIDKDFYRFLLTDDGPVEWAQFACFALAFVASALVALARFRQGHRGAAGAVAAFAQWRRQRVPRVEVTHDRHGLGTLVEPDDERDLHRPVGRLRTLDHSASPSGERRHEP